MRKLVCNSNPVVIGAYVYFICFQDGSMYIGSTDNLSQRLYAHALHRWRCAITNVYALVFEKIADARWYERMYIALFRDGGRDLQQRILYTRYKPDVKELRFYLNEQNGFLFEVIGSSVENLRRNAS